MRNEKENEFEKTIQKKKKPKQPKIKIQNGKANEFEKNPHFEDGFGIEPNLKLELNWMFGLQLGGFD